MQANKFREVLDWVLQVTIISSWYSHCLNIILNKVPLIVSKRSFRLKLSSKPLMSITTVYISSFVSMCTVITIYVSFANSICSTYSELYIGKKRFFFNFWSKQIHVSSNDMDNGHSLISNLNWYNFHHVVDIALLRNKDLSKFFIVNMIRYKIIFGIL